MVHDTGSLCSTYYEVHHLQVLHENTTLRHRSFMSRSLGIRLWRHSPRSEHWTTVMWHWHPNGQLGCFKNVSKSTKAEPSSSSFIINCIRLFTSTVLPMSGSPFCWKGEARERPGKVPRRRRMRQGFMASPQVWIWLWWWGLEREHVEEEAASE